MSNLKTIIQDLFANENIEAFVAYKNNKPFIVRKSEDAMQVDEIDNQEFNLAAYLNKPEIKKLSKLGILANMSTMKALVQLANENQITSDKVKVISADAAPKKFERFEEVTEYIKANSKETNADLSAKVAEIKAMSREERRDFWNKEFSKCIKCYACRSSCPMCYCTKCMVEANQPQFVPVASHAQGNFEWHFNRAMHLAGRCVGCNQCASVCPMDIPLNLLNQQINETIAAQFGETAGEELNSNYTLSFFKENDKENFIR